MSDEDDIDTLADTIKQAANGKSVSAIIRGIYAALLEIACDSCNGDIDAAMALIDDYNTVLKEMIAIHGDEYPRREKLQ